MKLPVNIYSKIEASNGFMSKWSFSVTNNTRLPLILKNVSRSHNSVKSIQMTAQEKILVDDPRAFIAGVDCPVNSGEFSSIAFFFSKEPSIFYQINTNTAGNAMVQILGSKLSKDLNNTDSGRDKKLLIE